MANRYVSLSCTDTRRHVIMPANVVERVPIMREFRDDFTRKHRQGSIIFAVPFPSTIIAPLVNWIGLPAEASMVNDIDFQAMNDVKILSTVLSAAHYFDQDAIASTIGDKLATFIRNKPVELVRHMFEMKRDLTQEEEDELDAELSHFQIEMQQN